MLKAIIFDMDDTLVDWKLESDEWVAAEHSFMIKLFEYLLSNIEPLGNVGDHVAAAHRLIGEAYIEAQREMHAPNFMRILEQSFAACGIVVSPSDVDTYLRSFQWELMGAQAFPDVTEILPLFVSHHIKLGLITNALYPMWMRDRELQAFGLLPHFADCRLSSGDVGYLKPHAAIFQAALDCLQVLPEEAVFIGDNPEADVAGAQAVGMRGVLRLNPKAPRSVASAVVPDGTIASLHDLLPMLDQWYPGWRIDGTVSTPGDLHGTTTSHPVS